MLDCNRPTSVSNLSCTNKVDNDFNNNDDGQYFATPIKHNHRATTIRDTNTTTEQVQFEVHQRLCQRSCSVTKKTFKISLSEREYLCFQTDLINSQSAQCARSRALTKVIESIFEIE